MALKSCFLALLCFPIRRVATWQHPVGGSLEESLATWPNIDIWSSTANLEMKDSSSSNRSLNLKSNHQHPRIFLKLLKLRRNQVDVSVRRLASMSNTHRVRRLVPTSLTPRLLSRRQTLWVPHPLPQPNNPPHQVNTTRPLISLTYFQSRVIWQHR